MPIRGESSSDGKQPDKTGLEGKSDKWKKRHEVADRELHRVSKERQAVFGKVDKWKKCQAAP